MTGGVKLVVRVLQDLTRRKSYRDYTEVVEDLKAACAKMRIHYNTALVWEAVDRLERGGQQPIVRRTTPNEARESNVLMPLSRDEATNILDRLRRKLNAPAPKTMPGVVRLGADDRQVRAILGRRFTADKRKAFELVEREMLATEERCDALEASIENQRMAVETVLAGVGHVTSNSFAQTCALTWRDSNQHEWVTPSALLKRMKWKNPLHWTLRAYVFHRDGFRCCECGAHPAFVSDDDRSGRICPMISDDPLRYLLIDHLISLKNGGSNHPDNLRTCCDSCNAAKVGHFDTRLSEALRT